MGWVLDVAEVEGVVGAGVGGYGPLVDAEVPVERCRLDCWTGLLWCGRPVDKGRRVLLEEAGDERCAQVRHIELNAIFDFMVAVFMPRPIRRVCETAMAN